MKFKKTSNRKRPLTIDDQLKNIYRKNSTLKEPKEEYTQINTREEIKLSIPSISPIPPIVQPYVPQPQILPVESIDDEIEDENDDFDEEEQDYQEDYQEPYTEHVNEIVPLEEQVDLDDNRYSSVSISLDDITTILEFVPPTRIFFTKLNNINTLYDKLDVFKNNFNTNISTITLAFVMNRGNLFRETNNVLVFYSYVLQTEVNDANQYAKELSGWASSVNGNKTIKPPLSSTDINNSALIPLGELDPKTINMQDIITQNSNRSNVNTNIFYVPIDITQKDYKSKFRKLIPDYEEVLRKLDIVFSNR